MKILSINKMRFTAIEWVLIIVVAFILSAIAIPRFYNPFGEAQQKKIDTLASSLTNAAAENYATCEKHKKCIAITKCSDSTILLTPPLTLAPTGDAILDQYNIAVDLPVEKNGQKATCTLQIKKLGVLYSKTYIVIGAKGFKR